MRETKEQIINLINSGNFAELEQIVLGLNDDSLQELMNDLGYYQTKDIFLVCSDNAREKMINVLKDNEQKQFMILALSLKKAYQFIANNKAKIDDNIFKKIICDIIQSSDVDLKKKILFEDKIMPDISNLELHQILGKKFVKENIKDIIKLELNENDIDRKLELIARIEENVGDNIYLNMDFNILNTKYIDVIGIDGIINIALNNEKQNELLNLDETRLKLLGICLDNKSNRTDIDTYCIILDKTLTNISTDRFNNIISDIDEITDLTDEDIKTFQQIIQNNNIFEINSLNELRDYENVKKQKCDEWINSDNIEKKRLAVFEKIFGQESDFLNRLQMRFSDVEEIENKNISQYIKCIRGILQIDNPKVLEDFYNTCSQKLEINDVLIEQEIEKEYGKLFNEGLLRIEQCEEIGDNFYEAGTDFKMIVHCRQDYQGTPDNYFKDWNREKANSNDYLCASYIRNDMIATYPAGKILYGFNKLEPTTICGNSVGDGGTLGAMQNLTTPNNLINSVQSHSTGENENCYNELNYKRFNNGERQQPSYIVVFRINGEIDKTILTEAKKAQEQWDNKLPIVVVDVNKCIEAERQKVEKMRKEYEQTKSPILAREIYHKIKNNQATIAHHKGKIKTTFFEEEMQQYNVSDEEIELYNKEHQQENTNITKSKIDIIYDELTNLKATKQQSEKIEQQKNEVEITPKDIVKLDQERKITTTEVQQNIVKRLLDKVKEKIIQGKKKDGR